MSAIFDGVFAMIESILQPVDGLSIGPRVLAGSSDVAFFALQALHSSLFRLSFSIADIGC